MVPTQRCVIGKDHPHFTMEMVQKTSGRIFGPNGLHDPEKKKGTSVKEKKRLKRNDKYRYSKGTIHAKYGSDGKEVPLIKRPNGVDKNEWADLARKMTLHLNIHNNVCMKADRRNDKLVNRLVQERKLVNRMFLVCGLSLAGWFFSVVFLLQSA